MFLKFPIPQTPSVLGFIRSALFTGVSLSLIQTSCISKSPFPINCKLLTDLGLVSFEGHVHRTTLHMYPIRYNGT
ncbi:hypothetical protein F4782DRAFT_509256 [Xylaria castorea]|nr:hypothetical protein F4782DRAFT_509256 [Xylaria castorea]